MDVKEASNVFWKIYTAYPEYEDELNEIEELLQQGEAYRLMWRQLKYGFKNKKFFLTAIVEDTPIKYVEYFIEDLEQKYFKEAKQDEAEDDGK